MRQARNANSGKLKRMGTSASNKSATKKLPLSRIARLLLVLGIVAAVVCPFVVRFDNTTSQSIRKGDIPGDLRKAIELSEAFAHGSGATAILLGLLLCTRPPRNGVWVVILMTATSGIVANAMKAAFTRARPYTLDGNVQPFDLTGWQFLGSGSFWDASQRSFPSGHTATAWGLGIGLALLFPRATPLFLILASMATFQRLYSGAHFPSDAVAGFAVACVSCGLLLLIPRFREQLERN